MKQTMKLTWLRGLALFAAFLSFIGRSIAAEEVTTNKWEVTASTGATVTRGNSETLLFTADVLGLRKWTQDELRLGADGSYGEDHDVKNNERLHGFGQFNKLFTDRFYGYARADALHDGISDIEYRLTLSPGVGYYFIKTDRMSLSGEVGPAVIFEKQGDDSTTYFTLRVAERFEYQLTERARFWQSAEWLPQVDDFNNYLLNVEVGIETDISDHWKLRVFAVDNYDNEPAPGRKANDIKLVAALAYAFK
jgi:putative salt-induced outer membrane protein YdiY